MGPVVKTAAVALALSLSGPVAAQKPGPKPGTIVQPDAIEWKPLSSKQPVGGPVIHVLWGKAPNAAGGFLLKLPGEGELPTRTHPNAYTVVVISGTWVHDATRGELTEVLPGGYYTQPAKQRHRDRCVAGPDCVVLIQTQGKFELRSSEVGIPVPPAPEPAPKQ